MTEVSSKSDSKKEKSNELDPCHSTLTRAYGVSVIKRKIMFDKKKQKQKQKQTKKPRYILVIQTTPRGKLSSYNIQHSIG